ncbi:MAG: hypothetical protein JWM40_632 [Frankiales bacterium]|nr:hypothetical protein [Frankiales bacterium]
MSRRAAALVLSAAVLSGCGVGLHAQTYTEKGRQDGSNVDLESILVRNLHIEPAPTGSTIPVGSDAVLTGSIVNRGQAADTLTSVTSDAATSVSLSTTETVPRFGGGSPFPLTIPAGGALTDWTATLTGLTKDLRAGEYVTVTLSFTNGGQTTLSVPVHLGDADLANREVDQEPYGSEG